ncbi:MAG: EamA family transporter [Thermodesulfovibrionales bacterium]
MLYILAAIFLWSSLGVVIRLSGVPVHLLIFFSSVISSFITGLMFLKKVFRHEVPKGRAFWYLFILGPISLVNTFSFFYAYKNTSVANAVLTHYTAPVFVAFLAPIFLKERLTWRILLAVATATLGLWIMLGVSVSHFLDLIIAGDRNTGGILAGLLSGLSYAVLIILFRIFAQGYHPLVMTFFQNLIISFILLPFIRIPMNFASAIWAFAVMGIVHSTIAPILYFRGMRDVTANRAAILGYLEPVCAIILGVIFLNEGININTMIGGLLIFLSGYLTIKDSSIRQ